jgi:hypothetical protein
MANPTSIARVQTDDRNINQLQQNIQTAVNPVLANPIVNGILLKDISLTSGNNTVDTKLGRQMQGYIITAMKSAYANVYQVSSTDIQMVLNSSGATTVDLYVF